MQQELGLVDRAAWSAVAADYPYLQGLWCLPLAGLIALAGVSNLADPPSGPWLAAIAAVTVAAAGGTAWFLHRYYRDRYGEVVPTPERQRRHLVAFAVWALILFAGANRFLLWTPDAPVCVLASAFAAGMLAYYAILVGLRPHQVAVWGAVVVAGLLPIWGGFGADRDPAGLLVVAAALAASGLLDQRLLAHSFPAPPDA